MFFTQNKHGSDVIQLAQIIIVFLVGAIVINVAVVAIMKVVTAKTKIRVHDQH